MLSRQFSTEEKLLEVGAVKLEQEIYIFDVIVCLLLWKIQRSSIFMLFVMNFRRVRNDTSKFLSFFKGEYLGTEPIERGYRKTEVPRYF